MAAVQSILVITKKKALDGWHETLAKFKHLKSYTVTNYHQVKKYGMDYDLVILDEAHNYLSAFQSHLVCGTKSKLKLKVSQSYIFLLMHKVHKACIISLSDWSPFKKVVKYSWFKILGNCIIWQRNLKKVD